MEGGRSLVGYSPWGRKESDTTEQLHSLTHSPAFQLSERPERRPVPAQRPEGPGPASPAPAPPRTGSPAEALWGRQRACAQSVQELGLWTQGRF